MIYQIKIIRVVIVIVIFYLLVVSTYSFGLNKDNNGSIKLKVQKLIRLTNSEWIQNFVWYPDGKAILFEKGEWFYKVDIFNKKVTKLIPGTCPQWSQDGKRFFYFLDVGYDGNRRELWSADRNGEARRREAKFDFFIQKSPAFAKAGRLFAHHYSRCTAAGSFQDIALVNYPRLELEENKPNIYIIYRKPFGVKLHVVGWLDDYRIAIGEDGKILILDVTSILSKDRNEKVNNSLKSNAIVKFSSHRDLRSIPLNSEISADGKLVAYFPEGRYSELWVRERDNKGLGILISQNVIEPWLQGPPRFSPKGYMVAFIKWSPQRRNVGDIYVAYIERQCIGK